MHTRLYPAINHLFINLKPLQFQRIGNRQSVMSIVHALIKLTLIKNCYSSISWESAL